MNTALLVFYTVLFALILVVAVFGRALFFIGAAVWNLFLETFDKMHGR